MRILSVRLASEDEKKLEQVLAVVQTDTSTLVRNLITSQWLSLKAGDTFVQRRGGHPLIGLLKKSSAGIPQGTRSKRKAAIEAYVKNKALSRGRAV